MPRIEAATLRLRAVFTPRRGWPNRRVALVAFALLIITAQLLSTGCSAQRAHTAPGTSSSFIEYQQTTQAWLHANRKFQTLDHSLEVHRNGPQEWRPTGVAPDQRPDKGILLVHGLGDSPWSFVDVAQQLADQGFLVRTLLLPGHGTHPAELQSVTVEDWRAVVRDQATTLQQDVDQVFLGGFSTGANLALELAYASPNVAGLVLLSPAFRSSSAWDWLTPMVARVRPWLIAPNEGVPSQNSVRYLNTPTNGFAQFYRSSRSVQQLLRHRPYEKPVLMVVSQNDSVLDTAFLLETFQTRFTHPASRLIWYGDPRDDLIDKARVLIRTDRLPHMRISQFSHMGILFSPDNDLYGVHGSLRLCWNGQEDHATNACTRGAPVWYSDWGYREAGKVHSRLTFNPYFDWQSTVIFTVLTDQCSSSANNLTQIPCAVHP